MAQATPQTVAICFWGYDKPRLMGVESSILNQVGLLDEVYQLYTVQTSPFWNRKGGEGWWGWLETCHPTRDPIDLRQSMVKSLDSRSDL